MKIFKEKGPRILVGQIFFLDCPLRVFLVGPPNHTFTHQYDFPWYEAIVLNQFGKCISISYMLCSKDKEKKDMKVLQLNLH
jgi:hypothetical protein